MNLERERKWKLYIDAKEWIVPYPSWFEKPVRYTVNDFVNHFNISEEEAQKLINRLVEDKKLKKSDEEGVYIALRLCDICGREFDDWDKQENHHHSYNFGFGSKHDLEFIEFDVCASCFDKLVDAILPLFPKSPMSEMDTYSEAPEYEPYLERVERHDKDPF